MGEAYFSLKRKLEELGYNNTLPIDAVPLVECIFADLLQTTRSLQHYMDLSKEALQQRDSLMLEAEPYKCDNAKLIQENNKLNREVIHLKEENMKISKELKRKIKAMTEELMKKDSTISKLQHDLRDLSLRGICAETQASRNKSRRKEAGDSYSKLCVCNDRKFYSVETDESEMQKKICVLQEKMEEYNDEIALLKNQIEHRDNEIVRLNILLEGGRPITAINKDCCNMNTDSRFQNLMKQIHDLENTNEILKKEISTGLEKQHEAMLRALSLADKNKMLQEEIQKVDTLALKVEEDCNKRLASMMNEVNFLQTRLEGLTMKNSQLEKELAHKVSKEILTTPKDFHTNELLNVALKEKDALQREIKDLVDLNKGLQDKILALSQLSKAHSQVNTPCEPSNDYKSCPTKHELELLLENERKKYEKHIVELQNKLSETIDLFNKQSYKCKDSKFSSIHGSHFIRDLQNKLCETEQKLLMLQKENDDIRSKMSKNEEGSKQNYKDIISQLNAENSELSKENISLSQQLSQYRSINSAKFNHTPEFCKKDIQKLKERIDELTHEAQILKKDKHEYNLKYKEAVDIIDKLKRDLVYKQKDIELLQEENSSFKMSHRTGKASTDHLRDECNFLREQMKKMQSDVIKEKTLANQIKNIQLETERSSSEIQNELLLVQKKLSVANEKVDSLERRCKELQSEIGSLKSDKSNLLDNIRKLDQERDKLVIELDHKAETISILEQKLKSQTFDMSKLEDEISDLKRKLNVNKVSEHKLVDNEAQIAFLNGEIMRLNQQLENAIMENKQLQNSLADANGTLKLTKIEYDKSRKEVDGMKQQLQHYVAEIRRIEELLSQKEAERSDMLEQFASLSVEANILENTNHSLESESASKSMQLQSYVSKIQSLEEKILDKESIIDSQSARLASMTCRVTALENEVKLLTEEKAILEQKISYLKQMCNNIHTEHSHMTKSLGDTDSELKLYENKIKTLTNNKAKLEVEKDELKDKLMTTEELLLNARKEIVDLKLALQDATSETKSLQDRVSRLSTCHADDHEITLTKELELPLMLEETIHEDSHEEDEESSRYGEIRKRFSKYSHGSTL